MSICCSAKDKVLRELRDLEIDFAAEKSELHALRLEAAGTETHEEVFIS